MDVDGTLTDGTLLVFPDGEELKTYHVRDGLGILLAHLAGLKTGIITGKTSKSLEIRSERLKMTEIHQGILDKKPVLDEILERNGLTTEEVAFIGDGNNVCNSFVAASTLLGFSLTVATPEGYEPDKSYLTKTKKVGVIHDPKQAVTDADIIYTGKCMMKY